MAARWVRREDLAVKQACVHPRSRPRSRTVVVTVARDGHDQHRALSVAVLAGIGGALIMGRFGLPPVDLHSPLHRVGIMNPLCGMTRATAALGRGALATAWRYNPGVFFLAAAAAGVLLRAGFAATTGTWWWVRARGWAVWVVALGALIALEVNQQLHAGLLR